MKNTNFTKIAVLVLSLALLMGAVVAVSASAADEPEIFAQNVIYGDKISIVYAVDTTLEAANAGEVKVKYYWEDAPEALYDAVLLDTTDTKNLCEGKPTFATTGVAPKELGKVAYATTYTGDAPAADAEWKTYSVAEYLYDRLYKDGYVNYDEGDGVDYNRKSAYEALLDLGANLQLVLGYNTNELATDYTYAYTTNADVTINGKRAAFDVASVNAVYSGDLAHVGWTITDLEGNETEAAKDAAIAVNGVIAISPKIEVHECADTNNDHYCDTCAEKLTNCAEGSVVDGLCDVCKTMSFEFSITTGVHLATGSAVLQESIIKGETYTPATKSGVWGNIVSVTKTFEGGRQEVSNVLKIVVNDNAKKGTSVGTLGGSVYFTPAKQSDDGGKIHVVEYDFNWASSAVTGWRNPFTLYAWDASGNSLGCIVSASSTAKYNVMALGNGVFTEGVVAENAYQMGISGTQSEIAGGSFSLLNTNTWYRIRYVWDQETGKVNIAASNDGGETWYKVCSEQTKKAYADADYLTISFDCVYNHGGTIYFDNINYNVVSTMPELPANNGITE